MTERPVRRGRRLLVAGAIVTAFSLLAGPAFAHGDEDHDTSQNSSTSKKDTAKDDAKEKAKKKAKQAKKKAKKKANQHAGHGTVKNGIMQTAAGAIIVGALTGDTPCELSGPPASPGQVAADAEGHDHRGPFVQEPVTKEERELLIEQQAAARSVADKYPTVAVAEADGYKKSTPFVPCIGAHYTKIPLIGKFDPAAPSELLFDGTNPDSKIIGLSYLVSSPGGAPDGFAGPNDRWHQHNTNGGLCLNSQGVVVGNETTTDADCKERGGRKVALDDLWMVHDWIVPGWECSWGVFAGECPELGGRLGGTAFDEPDPSLFEKAGSPSKESAKKKAKAKAAKKKAKQQHDHDHED